MIYLDLLLTFFKIGAFTFGGGYAMLPLIQSEVAAHGWIEEKALVDFIAVSESTPGPFAINMATYVGSVTGGFFGALCATLGVVLPSFIIILIVAKCYDRFKSSNTVKGCMSGLKPAAIGLIAAAVLSAGKTVFTLGMPVAELILSAVIFVVCLVCVFKKMHPVLVICIAAAMGILGNIFI